MPACSGSGCNNGVPWQIAKTGLTTDQPGGSGPGYLVVGFTFEDMGKVLNGVLQTGGMMSSVGTSGPPIKCLCPYCWLTYAARWGAAEGKSAD